MSDRLFAIFVLAFFIYCILAGTVFYEEPSCCTSNMDEHYFDFFLPFFLSVVIAALSVWIVEDVWKLIEGKKK